MSRFRDGAPGNEAAGTGLASDSPVDGLDADRIHRHITVRRIAVSLGTPADLGVHGGCDSHCLGEW